MRAAVWEIFTYGKQPYAGIELKEVMKAVTNGERLEQPADCPDDVWDMLFSCWIREPNRRPSFRQIRRAVEFLVKQHNLLREQIRDVGILLNKDLNSNIRALTLRRGSKGEHTLARRLIPSIQPQLALTWPPTPFPCALQQQLPHRKRPRP